MRSTTFAIGFAALYLHGGTAAPVADVIHVAGFQGQEFEVTGQDGEDWGGLPTR